MSGLPLLASLVLLWLAIIVGHRHHRRETASRLGVERHLRSVGSVPERWLDLREREGRGE